MISNLRNLIVYYGIIHLVCFLSSLRDSSIAGKISMLSKLFLNISLNVLSSLNP